MLSKKNPSSHVEMNIVKAKSPKKKITEKPTEEKMQEEIPNRQATPLNQFDPTTNQKLPSDNFHQSTI